MKIKFQILEGLKLLGNFSTEEVIILTIEAKCIAVDRYTVCIGNNFFAVSRKLGNEIGLIS